MEKRHFTHIAQTYSANNKLKATIQEALLPLNGTLFPDRQSASRKMNKRFMNACEAYLKDGGKAYLPDFKEYDIANGFGVQITDCMIIHFFEVREEIL